MASATRIIIGSVGFLTAMVGIAFANVAQSQMVQRINRDLPLNVHINDGFWYYSKAEMVHNQYRLIEPNGKLVARKRLGTTGMAIGLLAVMGSLVSW